MNLIANLAAELKLALTNPWVFFGFLGQFLFFTRWIVQWVASEKKKRSYIPVSFWYISLISGIILLTYAIHRLDPVFILGQTVGLANYARNIMLIRSTKSLDADSDIPA